MSITPFDEEDWLAWKDHPVSRAVLAFLEAEALERRERWTQISFDAGSVDPIKAAELRGEANGLLSAARHTYGELFPKE